MVKYIIYGLQNPLQYTRTQNRNLYIRYYINIKYGTSKVNRY